MLIAALAWLLGACASTPSESTSAPPYTDDELRNTDLDLIFATEFPVASKEDALSRAEMARTSGEIDKALFFYVKALKFDPEDAELLAAIGRLHQYQGNNRLAARAYSLALESRPEFPEVLEARGLILLGHDEEEQAISDLTRAVVLNPNAWQAYSGLGLLADRKGNHTEAIAHYDAALAINPDSGPVLNNRGFSKMLAYDFIGAEKDLSRAANELGHRQAWVNLGAFYGKLGLYDRAVETYEKVLPKPEARNKVAEASMAKGDYAEAERLLEQAIKLSPAYFQEAEDNLARILQRKGG